MARETVAQRNARQQAEREAYAAAMEASYPQRLMDMLERATKLSYELTVKEAKFVVREYNSNAKWVMAMAYDSFSEAALEALTYEVEDAEERRAEEQRRYEAKQAALAKLTDAEKALLGLK